MSVQAIPKAAPPNPSPWAKLLPGVTMAAAVVTLAGVKSRPRVCTELVLFIADLL